ncbi:u3 snoRNP protein, related [Neospora caninum Liverpool]|uniref:U3 snoRNP protein, related n=1 Tax=Neospora caninum (strain Liverpool) TaxID=572307 RepID=F0VCE8_NEOCL|nr:u3 snoRNP protein, related [Neospora caninum Liverpool]CBZ51270.1 u3 snoRNP protein, related [Neospora caninum Liverpool]CEL68585.1 TPA: U3 snoRNP protein, related [Neospora caninum Liverpool]|eukprot:XP_003881303.1 u3 snoRNP protein, related [Neospora caninum Liverpool]
MKISRRKQFKRVMRFYSVGFGIKEPFKVLVDGTFLTAALKHRLSLADRLPLLLGGPCTIMVTPCIVTELRQLPREKSVGAIAACKRLRRFKCGHDLDDARRHLVSLPAKDEREERDEENGENEESGESEEAERQVESAEDGASDQETDLPRREKFSLHPALAAFRARQQEEQLGVVFSKKTRSVSSSEKEDRGWKEAESHEAAGGTVFCADAFRCICRVVGQKNPSKLCVATQDRQLREKLRQVSTGGEEEAEQIPGVPLIFLYKGGILQLEPPTSKTREKHKVEERKKLRMGKEERRLFHETRRKVKAQNAGGPTGGTSSPSVALRGTEKKKKKARKGVNPLSCKKTHKTIVNLPKTKAKKTRSRRKKGSAVGAAGAGSTSS